MVSEGNKKKKSSYKDMLDRMSNAVSKKLRQQKIDKLNSRSDLWKNLT